jgi:uncharacterized membrane protein YfcA
MSVVLAWSLYLLLGAIAGIVAGLLGVGGGLIIVPVLATLFAMQGMSADVIMHVALGTSLTTIVFTSLSSMRAHHQHAAVDWHTVIRLVPGIIVGAWLGAAVADHLDTPFLRIFFGVFECLVAIQMWFGLKVLAHRQLPGPVGMSLAGLVIGGVSAVVGIGGGTMSVPFLTWCRVKIQRAVGTSAAIGLPIALAGASGYIVSGLNAQGLPAYSSGYVHWPAFAGIVVASILFAPLGARLAHSLPTSVLKRIFALLLAVLGARMLFA